MAQLRRDHRLPLLIALKGKASRGVVPSPVDGCACIEEQPGDVEIRVMDLAALLDAMPANGVGDSGGIRRSIADGVWDIAKIVDVLVGDAQARLSLSQVNLDRVGWDSHGPEQATGERENARVEVVDLRREIRKVKLTFVDVQSDKGKGTLMHTAIDADIYPLHESHVYVEEQTTCSGTLDFGGADESIEVVDRGWLLTRGREHVKRGVGE